MELLAFIFVWPFLLFAAGMLMIAGMDVFGGTGGRFDGFGLLQLVAYGFILYVILMALFGKKKKPSEGYTLDKQLDDLKRGMVVVSIAMLLPIFTRYLVQSFKGDLIVMVVGLLIAFGLSSWGLFVKGNRILTYGNVFGGLFSLIYLYSQLWSLGEGARIVAAAFGLVMAVTLSIVKLKGKLA